MAFKTTKRADRLRSYRDADVVAPQLTTLAADARRIIEGARADGLTIDDGNVVDLLADNIPYVPLDTFRDALVVAGYSAQFPKAVRS